MAFGLRQLQPEEMGRGGVTRTLIRLAIPSVVAGLLATTYEAVDGLFISWLGAKQITGIAFGSTVLFFAFAIGAAVQLGVATLLSRRLGENDPEGARNVLEQALLVSFVVGMVGSVLGPLTAKPVVAWLGASGDELTHGARYISRITMGMVFMHVGMTAEAGLRAQGNTVTGMHVSLLGNVANLILDGFLIFGPNNPARDAPQVWGLRQAAAFFTEHGFDLGVQGGATATLMTRLLVVVLLLAALCSQRTRVRAGAPWRIRPNDFWRTVGQIYVLGVPVTVSIVGMALSNGAINWILSQHNSTAAGILGIARRLEMFAFVPIFSLSGAVVPMVSYNLGAGLIPRCRRAILMGCLIAGVMMGAFGAVIFIFPAPVLRLFTQNAEMLDMGVSYLRINSWSYFFVGCDIILSAGLQGLGRAILSTLAQLTRAVFVKIPAAWVLATLMGVTGVWISNPISTLACFSLASLLMWWALRHIPRRTARSEAAAASHDVVAPADLPAPSDMPPGMD
ncbi:MAG TPA: MATE family efflux transporter [Phycisphaerae bacterium]|nr:MATE family efflux transporter [Phycisphaerae bacterium]HOI54301.1 MATE family efflux transporter [Phycisphaerae bacterium]